MSLRPLRRARGTASATSSRLAVAALFVVLGATACSRPASKELQPGSYRAVVDAGDGHAIPFGLDIGRDGQGWALALVNGDERTPMTDARVETGQLEARFATPGNLLQAEIAGGKLTGRLTLAREGGRELSLPLEATLGETWRFFPETRSDNADMSGRWELTLTDARGQESRVVADLRQRFAEVTGTVYAPGADPQVLAGEVNDEDLRLSRFDGVSLVLYAGRLDAEGRWVGDAWSDRSGARRFVAVRNPDATIEPPAPETEPARPSSDPPPPG